MAGYRVTEHCAWQTRRACGQIHPGEFPAGVSEAVQYGPNVRALAVHLNHGQLLPLARKISEFGVLTDWIKPTMDMGKPCRPLITNVDADGNETAGIRLPEIAVPLGTYTGWNLYK